MSTYTLVHRLPSTDIWTVRGTFDGNEIVHLDTVASETTVALANAGKDSLYSVAMTDDWKGAEMDGHWIQASLPACTLAKSLLDDEIILTQDHEGHFFSLQYHARYPPGNCAGLDKGILHNIKSFNTSVQIQTPAKDWPIRLRPLPRLSPQGEEVPLAKPTPWYRQYWYIWVPILILLLSQGVEEPPKKQATATTNAKRTASSGVTAQAGSGVRLGVAR